MSSALTKPNVATPRMQQGFTIVELLIATLVFSIILVVITVGVMQFSRAYYKGVTASSTQNASRTSMDEITQAIQFSGDTVVTSAAFGTNNGSSGFCVGNQRYSYLPGWQLEEGKNDVSTFQNSHVFVRDTPAGGCKATGLKPQDLRSGSVVGTELVSPHMRVSIATLEQPLPAVNDNLYRMTLRIVFGDADLLSSTTAGNVYQKAKSPNAVCQSLPGNQFCAVSQLTSTVERRVVH